VKEDSLRVKEKKRQIEAWSIFDIQHEMSSIGEAELPPGFVYGDLSQTEDIKFSVDAPLSYASDDLKGRRYRDIELSSAGDDLDDGGPDGGVIVATIVDDRDKDY
jgi:hypothetical protein